ncbi:MAG: hypothetical protein LBT59_20335 [Clostridiales bacterium]|jgi:stage V sporulation protein D (sporulation-specific penicillin-binding protein)|nr:hypothetical protein [Clostridiales bacterium]
MRLFGLAVCAAILALIGVLLYISVAYKEAYSRATVTQLAYKSNNIERIIPAARGMILDRNRQQLVASYPIYHVILDPNGLLSIEKEDTRDKILALTANIVDLDLGVLKETAYAEKNKTNKYCVIKRGISAALKNELSSAISEGVPNSKLAELGFEIEESKLEEKFYIQAIYLEADTKREYAKKTFAPQVLGFMRGEDFWGIESKFNSYLQGSPGRVFRRYDSYNTVITDENPATPGKTLVTTLDAGIQEIAQKACDNAAAQFMPEHASAIVMNPKNGEILGMAQSPSFDSSKPGDPSGFSDELLRQSYPLLAEDEQLNALYSMWANFNVTSTFEPGSIFKPIVISAAIEEGVVGLEDTFYCGGSLQVADRNIACWIQSSGRIHGRLNLTQSLANSCNVALMEIIDLMGRDIFFKYRSDFGFGEKTGIDLPGENGASAALMYTLDQLNPVQLATSSIGQGFNCTAIQAITAFSAVINGGNLMQPHVVSQILDDKNEIVQEFKPQIIRSVISAETSEWMRTALVSVLSPEGTGKNAAIEGYSIGGKTGTAQQGADRDKYTVSFISYLPAEDPQYVLLAIIDKPYGDSTGATSASPMMKEMLEGIIKLKGIEPFGENAAFAPSGVATPNFSGLQLAEATHQLNGLALDYRISGYGNLVTGQFPSAGQLATSGSEIILYVEPSGISEMNLAPVPDIKGLTIDQAQASLASVGLVPALFYDPSATLPSEPVTGNFAISTTPIPGPSVGIVYDQMPAAGVKVTAGVEVKMKIRLN